MGNTTMATLKTCQDCGQEKTLSDFYTAGLYLSGEQRYSPYCKLCAGLRTKVYRAAREFMPGRRAFIYGVSPERYATLLAEQNGVCAACGEPETAVRGGHVFALAVDHDHSCCPGKTSCGQCVRGLVCMRCNLILGHAKDDPGVFLSLIEYLAGDEAIVEPAPNMERTVA